MELTKYSKYKVLIVDDEPSIIGALKRTFFDEEWESYYASSGKKGLEKVYENDFALVLSDYTMSDMNGVEFLTEVRKVSPQSVRMIISGYAEAHAIVDAINQGRIFRFIPKPWNNTELVNIIKQGIDFYSLFERNRDLKASLRDKNAELAAINRDLEERVNERTSELLAHNKGLTFVEELFNDLPYGILGIDPAGLIVFANKLAFKIFSADSILLGLDTKVLLPESINKVIFDAIDYEIPEVGKKIDLDGQPYIIETVPMLNKKNKIRGITLIVRKDLSP
jgi:FixJ family two-component response regulator